MNSIVLVVEDEPAIQELVAVNLEHAGYRVWRASSAEDAETMVRDALPDVVLLDWMLPGTSGLAYARPSAPTMRSKSRVCGSILRGGA